MPRSQDLAIFVLTGRQTDRWTKPIALPLAAHACTGYIYIYSCTATVSVSVMMYRMVPGNENLTVHYQATFQQYKLCLVYTRRH